MLSVKIQFDDSYEYTKTIEKAYNLIDYDPFNTHVEFNYYQHFVQFGYQPNRVTMEWKVDSIEKGDEIASKLIEGGFNPHLIKTYQ